MLLLRLGSQHGKPYMHACMQPCVAGWLPALAREPQLPAWSCAPTHAWPQAELSAVSEPQSAPETGAAALRSS